MKTDPVISINSQHWEDSHSTAHCDTTAYFQRDVVSIDVEQWHHADDYDRLQARAVVFGGGAKVFIADQVQTTQNVIISLGETSSRLAALRLHVSPAQAAALRDALIEALAPAEAQS